MLIVSFLLYLVLAMLLSLRVFQRISFSKTILFTFLVTVSFNILIVELLSMMHALSQAWIFLLLQVILCLVCAILVWDPTGRLFKERLSAVKFEFNALRGWDWLPVLLSAGLLGLCLYIGSLVPINNSDSLHTHLPRIYYWIQHGSLASWNAITVTQLNYPINLPIQGVWLILLGGAEKLFFLVTWLGLLTAAVLVYEIALLLGSSNRPALVAALIALSFPVILLQTFSYQGDVFVATLALASVYFLLLYIREKRAHFLYPSLLALAVALGAKQSAFLILPFYLLVLLVLFIRQRVKFRQILLAGGLFLLFFGALSSYKFIQNYLERDQLSSSMFATYRYTAPFSEADALRQYATNGMRYLYQGASVDGLNGRLKLAAIHGRERLFRALSSRLGLNLEVKAYISQGDEEYFTYAQLPALNEDAAWFGSLSFTLFPIAVLVVLISRNKMRKKYLLVTLLVLLTTFATIAVLISGWSPTNGRYMILPVLLMAPLLAVLIPQRRLPGALVSILLSLLAAGLGFSTLLINDSNPLVTQYSLYAYQDQQLNRSKDAGLIAHAYTYVSDRVIEDLVLTSPDRKDILHQTYYENLFYQSTSNIPDIEFVNANIPASETLYVYMPKNIIEYALFGINKTRDVNPVSTLDQVPAGALLLADDELVKTTPAGMTLVAENIHFLILRNK